MNVKHSVSKGSSLGVTAYYRALINDYAKMSKPLTKYLKGEHGKVSQYFMLIEMAVEFDLKAQSALADVCKMLEV